MISSPPTLGSVVTIALAALLAFQAVPAHAEVETSNLIRNGDFEEPGALPPGWKIDVTTGEKCDLTPDALTGTKALKFSLPAAGTVTAISEPCVVTGGDDYLCTFWYRANGMTGKGTVRFYSYVIWQDADGKDLGNVLTEMPPGPVPDYRVSTSTVTAPADATRALLKFVAMIGQDYQGPETVFVLDQVRLMKLSKVSVPADAPKWEYSSRTLSTGLKMVDDPDAAQGQAIVAELGAARYLALTFGPDTTEHPIGEYQAVFRLKVKDNTKKEPVASLDVIDIGSLNFVLASRTLLATDFKAPGVYQDFTLRFVRPEEGMLEFRVMYQAATDLFYDKKKVLQLADFATDRKQAAIWLGGEPGPAAPAAPPTAPAARKDTVLVLAGLDNQICFPRDAVPQTLKLKYSYLARIQTGTVLDQAFPKKIDELNEVGLIVLANVPASALNGLMGRRTLRQFVERGGGLLVFGGPFSLGKGEYAESILEPVLPVITRGPWDLVKVNSAAVKVSRNSPITSDLDWKKKPILCYCQASTPKNGAEPLLECNGMPVLVTGQYGKGRVAVVAGTDLGMTAENQVLLYQWPDYAKLLTRVIQWLLAE